jgi:hypothetical protein
MPKLLRPILAYLTTGAFFTMSVALAQSFNKSDQVTHVQPWEIMLYAGGGAAVTRWFEHLWAEKPLSRNKRTALRRMLADIGRTTSYGAGLAYFLSGVATLCCAVTLNLAVHIGVALFVARVGPVAFNLVAYIIGRAGSERIGIRDSKAIARILNVPIGDDDNDDDHGSEHGNANGGDARAA